MSLVGLSLLGLAGCSTGSNSAGSSSAASSPFASEKISSVAGTGTQGFAGDGGQATSAQLNYPSAVAVDASGNMYIADSQNYRVRKVTAAGVISTVAGNGTAGFSGDGGQATSATINSPLGLAVDASGNLYIALADNITSRVRKVTPAGVITTVAGTATAGYLASQDGGLAVNANLNYPTGVAVDAVGNLYIADFYNSRVRKVTTGGIISTVAGTGTAGFNGDGQSATLTQLNQPYAVAVDGSGNLFIDDRVSGRIRKLTAASGTISTVAGNGQQAFSGDGGAATSAALQFPYGIAVDPSGNLYIADYFNNRVRGVTPGGLIFTVAGTGATGTGGDGGAASSAQIYSPSGVAVDSTGTLYISDDFGSKIRKVK